MVTLNAHKTRALPANDPVVAGSWYGQATHLEQRHESIDKKRMIAGLMMAAGTLLMVAGCVLNEFGFVLGLGVGAMVLAALTLAYLVITGYQLQMAQHHIEKLM